MAKQRDEERSVATWDPFRELGLFEGWSPLREFGFPSRLARRPELGFSGEFAPAIDVTEGDGSYVITAEIPGCKKDDVNVEIHDNVITVSGEKRSEREEKKEKSRWVERSYGRFARSFSLPTDADPDRVDASFKDGVLTVEIAKTEEKKPKTISISSKG